VPSTVAGAALRAFAHCRMTSWSVVTRLRPGRSGLSAVEVISWEYFSESEVAFPVRLPPDFFPEPEAATDALAEADLFPVLFLPSATSP
jgi:hypothetical protein